MNSSELPLISVIMPAYNSSRYLSYSIDSVISQSYKNFELILIYDQSEDDTLEIINKYVVDDPRIFKYFSGKNSISDALNLGIENCKGSLIARMDSDDICFKDRFENQVNYLQKNNLDICGGNVEFIDSEGQTKGISQLPESDLSCSLSLAFLCPFIHPAVMIKKNFLDDFDLKYGQTRFNNAEDLDLWIRMKECGANLGNMSKVLIKYRVSKNSLSRRNKKMLTDSRDLSNKYFHQHYDYFFGYLKSFATSDSKIDQDLAVRFIFSSFFRKGNFSVLRQLKTVNFKIVIYSFLSEILRIIKFKG